MPITGSYLALHREAHSDEPLDGEGDDKPDGRVANGVGQRTPDRQPVADEPRPRLDRVVVLPGHGEGERQVQGVIDGERRQVDVGGGPRHRAPRQHLQQIMCTVTVNTVRCPCNGLVREVSP